MNATRTLCRLNSQLQKVMKEGKNRKVTKGR